MTEAEYIAVSERLRSKRVEPMFERDWGKSERLSRIKSPAFENLRGQGIQNRDNVKARNVRIHEIAIKIRNRGWLSRPNLWIANRLARESNLSQNTIRPDVALAKKNLMGSQNPKN